MDAPEKIYYAPYGDMRENAPITDNDIEYVRKNAFIEKAADYIKRHSALLDSDGNDCMPEWIENFKKAMKL